jgi:tetratricopeptide (TPR) repeat protein
VILLDTAHEHRQISTPFKPGKAMAWGAALLLFLLIPLTDALADKLILKDGRVLLECRVERIGQELYVIFPHGRLKLAEDRIKELYQDLDETYEPRTKYEIEQFQKGLVFFEGSWTTARRRDAALQQRREAREKRLTELAKHLEWANAWRKETPHFMVMTNTSEALLDYYTDLFEKFYDHFTMRWNITDAKSAKKRKPLIKIYRNRGQYIAAGAPPLSNGLFIPTQGEMVLYHDPADPRFTLDVLFHEGTHLMFHFLRSDFIYPPWIYEGMAEYYGSSTLDESDRIQSGHIQEGRLAVLRYALEECEFIPLTKVLLTPEAQFKPIHYAESWCLVHFLLEHKKYKSHFFSYFSSLVTGMGLDEVVFAVDKGKNLSTLSLQEGLAVFMKKLGLATMDELNREFLEYVYYGLPEVGVRGYLDSARIKMREHDLDGALEDLTHAIELGSQDATCYLYKGRISAVMGNFPAAAAEYMKTLELDPLNPEYHLEAGRAFRVSGDRLMMEEGLRHIHLSCEIAPDDPRYDRILDQTLLDQDLPMLDNVRRSWHDAWKKRREEQAQKEAEQEKRKKKISGEEPQ